MSGLKLIIAGTIASISLVTAVALPSPDRASRPPAARVIPFGPSTSELMNDQLMLVRDMRKLRRELKRGAGSTQIAAHRDEIRRDWLNIVQDREFPGLRPGDITPELALWKPRPRDFSHHSDSEETQLVNGTTAVFRRARQCRLTLPPVMPMIIVMETIPYDAT